MTQSLDFDVPNLDESAPLPSEGRKRYSCVGCGLHSPPVETNFTLISSRFGWRLLRYRDEKTGVFHMDWRCPTCFRTFREERRRKAIARISTPPPRRY